VKAVCWGQGRVGRTVVQLSPDRPIVAVGGPVKVYYDEVARRLNTPVVFAPYCDVANAVGAASALVAARVVVTVEGDGNGLFRVHGGGNVAQFGSGRLALAHAEELARRLALAQAQAQGAEDPRLEVLVERNLMPEARDDDGLLTAVVSAEALGRPVEN
jgi:hypothetical protein